MVERRGHTEAAVDLARFASEHGPRKVSVAAIAEHRRAIAGLEEGPSARRERAVLRTVVGH